MPGDRRFQILAVAHLALGVLTGVLAPVELPTLFEFKHILIVPSDHGAVPGGSDGVAARFAVVRLPPGLVGFCRLDRLALLSSGSASGIAPPTFALAPPDRMSTRAGGATGKYFCDQSDQGRLRGGRIVISAPFVEVLEATMAAAVCWSGWLGHVIAHTAWRLRLPCGHR